MSLADLTTVDRAAWSFALDDLEGIPRGREAVRAAAVTRWRTPGEMAQELVPGTVQTAMLDHLDGAIVQADTGEHRRWIINTPPQEGKSSRLCRDASLWLLLRNPNRRIVIASYQQTLAEAQTLDVRQLIEKFGTNYGHPDEDDRLGLSIDPSRGAMGNWRLAGHRGGMVAAGVGSGITGKPGDVIVVDDPLADAEAADSPTMRAKVIAWWTSVVQTRLIASSIVIVVQCIAEGERVLTADGRWLPIESVAPGHLLAALDESGRLVPREVLAARCSGQDDVITVRTDRLSLAVNRRHPFAVLRPRGVRCDPTDVQWVQADKLKPGDVVVTAKHAPSMPTEATLANGDLVDLDRAWLLGYMLGDGWVTRSVRKYNSLSYSVMIATSDKPHFDERAIKELERWAPVRVYQTKYGYIRCDWAAGGRILHAMGYGRGAHGKRVPDVVWSWPGAHRREFLLGYAHADGSRLPRCHDSWRVGSVSRGLVLDVRDLALTCGVRPGRLSSFVASAQPPNSPQPVTSVCWTLSLAFAQDSAEGRALITSPGHRDPRHVRYEKIRSIETGGRARVYDLTMTGSENFVAEGYVVHNTRWNEEDLSGWLIANDNRGDPYYRVLSIPAQAEANDPLGRQPGEWLVSARQRTVDEWEDTKREVTKGGIRWWFALYQQRPAPPSGDTFQLDWFDRDRVWTRPPGPPPVVVIDPADNTGTGDEAGIIVASVDHEQRIYIGPDYSGHYTTARWVRLALLAVVRHNAGGLAFEKSLSGLQRSVRDGWDALYKQARIIRRLIGTSEAAPIDPDVIERAAIELCHPEDSDATWQQVRSELMELWPSVDGALAFPATGPMVRCITPRGTKSWRAQAASPKYEHRLVSHIGNLANLEHQMSTWQPGQKSPDRMDAAVHAVLLLSGASVASLERPSGNLPPRSTRRNPSVTIPRSARR